MGNNGQLLGKNLLAKERIIITRKKKSPLIVEKETFPHFRKYKKSGHPALITGEHTADEYNYRKVMHSPKDGKRNNERIDPNPNRLDPKPMYIGKRTRHDKKKYFDNKPLPWKYPKENKKM